MINSYIFEAAKNGKWQVLENILLVNNEATKLIDSKGDTLLMTAIRHGENYTAVNLIEKSDLSVQNQDGDTPIILATRLENNYLTQNLLSAMNHTQLALKNNAGDTCLLIAARKGNNYLVSNMAAAVNKKIINMQDSKGFTALSIAAKNNNNYMTANLVNAGANPYIKNNENISAFEYSIQENNSYAMSLYRDTKYTASGSQQNLQENSLVIENITFLEKIKILINRFMSSFFGREKIPEQLSENKTVQTIKGVEVQGLYSIVHQPIEFKKSGFDNGLHKNMAEKLTSFLNKAKNNEQFIEVDSIISLKDRVLNVVQLHQRVDDLALQIKEENLVFHATELQTIYKEIIDTLNTLENCIDSELLKDVSKEIKIHKKMYQRK